METVVDTLRRTIGLDPASIGMGAIERAVQQRMTATHTATPDRYRHLLHETPGELRALIDTLVVPETWFFRDRGAFVAVAAEAMLPAHSSKLRYLCVPCATGEEPLSLAMALQDAGVEGDRYHIDAFDISDRVVRHAERGLYGKNSFRGTYTEYRARYFHATPEGCAIDPAVRRQVTFRQANLLDDLAFHGAQIYDAIFCRNLLIYFDTEARNNALKKIARLLRDDGLLCVAPAETGLLLRHGFVPAEAPQAFAFRKDRKPAKTREALPAMRHEPHPAFLPGRMVPSNRQEPPPQPVETEEEPLPTFADALRLADEGRFEEVSKICQANIDAHGASADAYYLLALVSDASARHEEAATFYRKALYLDPNHRDALAHFSLLAEKLGQTETAGALRRRALRLESHAA
jgi:chemotaxis protein methyltransferase WspC